MFPVPLHTFRKLKHLKVEEALVPASLGDVESVWPSKHSLGHLKISSESGS